VQKEQELVEVECLRQEESETLQYAADLRHKYFTELAKLSYGMVKN
jgi:hypothetical protein